MRRLLVASVLAAGLAGALAVSAPPSLDNGAHRLRKTMGFGPEHPHAVFRTNVPPTFQPSPSFRASEQPHPFDIAKEFVKNLVPESSSLKGELDGAVTFYVRPDSYVDENTGIAHVYLRQTVFGIEVADGDVNVNINARDGRVLSYGSSIHTNELPSPAFFSSQSDSEHVHAKVCSDLGAEYSARLTELHERSQALYPNPSREKNAWTAYANDAAAREQLDALATEVVGEVGVLHTWNCHRLRRVSTDSFAPQSEDENPLTALLSFMLHATPSEKLAADIHASPRKYVDGMTLTIAHHLHNSDAPASPAFEISGVPDATDKVRGRLAWAQVPKAEGGEMGLELVWKFEVPMADNWYETAVTFAEPHRIVSVVDWAADGFIDKPQMAFSDFLAPIPEERPSFPATRAPAKYVVHEWGVNDPSESNRTVQYENFDGLASPVGWHVVERSSDPATSSKEKLVFRNTTTTWGNNVFAHENWEGENAWVTNYRPEAAVGVSKDADGVKGERAVFDFEYDPQATERSESMREARKYINATVTQLFYTSNLVHDLFYRYGFDEVSGNFQQHNFGRGGKGNDAVIANAQDGSGFNNANFMTPPDGQNGRCRMYLWNTANPYRDGDMEAGIVIHELAHGLSTRLTGGPANSGCLGWGESGGMGEGWGDFLATTIRSVKDRVSDAQLAKDGLGEPREYPMGAWAANRDGGIRNYIYSLNMTTNPSTYKTLDKPGYWGVHAIGEVWAEILWVVEQKLIQKHGFSETLFPPKPLANGTVPLGDFYRNTTEGVLVPVHGNTLAVRLVVAGMKQQPCRPSFFDARDAIIAADEHLTGGENFCTLWEGFSERGLGPDARVEGRTPWGGGIRTDDYELPAKC
ncbi:fungalysin metallopeptidase-domain-containing protein [Phanerochaete sordida]|uniref:Extracellular metalloproteinase n=1 Tax=Phanerochaete sordida TaxID=48140 RepID=A0A9P3GET1_9APHY|nr:fungalysin metallopeptidase-domain-containing protein [Phanerochaete sordida]